MTDVIQGTVGTVGGHVETREAMAVRKPHPERGLRIRKAHEGPRPKQFRSRWLTGGV